MTFQKERAKVIRDTLVRITKQLNEVDVILKAVEDLLVEQDIEEGFTEEEEDAEECEETTSGSSFDEETD